MAMSFSRNSSTYGASSKFVSIAIAMKPKLPEATQEWSQFTTTLLKLQCALENPKITAIKADIVMGNTESEASHQEVLYKPPMPIMAHPPNKVSDLSMDQFIYLTLSSRKHHVKLAFKDIEAVSKTIQRVNYSNEEFNTLYDHPTVFLNADILPGPGRRNESPTLNADAFIETCLENMEDENDDSSGFSGVSIEARPQKFAFMLGWMTDPRAYSGYTKEDVEQMRDVIERHELLSRSKGVVLVVNARNLFKQIDVFDDILIEFPSLQILAQTERNEPPISNFQLKKIISYFEKNGFEKQLGFDCKAAGVKGLFHDQTLRACSIVWNIRKAMFEPFKTKYPQLKANGANLF